MVGNTLIAPGAKLSKGDMEFFRAEKLTGFNRNYYDHDKFILIDPLGTDPVVVTGTANFSVNSQTDNDENMLVIRGNTRVADIYFGEFMRVFDHFYSRYVVKKNQGAGREESQRRLTERGLARVGAGPLQAGPEELPPRGLHE